MLVQHVFCQCRGAKATGLGWMPVTISSTICSRPRGISCLASSNCCWDTQGSGRKDFISNAIGETQVPLALGRPSSRSGRAGGRAGWRKLHTGTARACRNAKARTQVPRAHTSAEQVPFSRSGPSPMRLSTSMSSWISNGWLKSK